jgi:three-Cys-motif partner protein
MARKHYDWKLGDAPPEIGHHSLAKHRILRRYIERYIEIVTAIAVQQELNIVFVDGYAGGGRYQFGDRLVPGSPLILREAVATMEARLSAERTKGFRINAEFYFIDQNQAHIDFLRAEIEASPFKSEIDHTIHIWTADFNERVADLIRAVKVCSPRAGRSIFLLDQYGWSQVAFRSVRQILESLPKAEVFLTFSVDSLIDYLSDSNSDLSRAFSEIDADPAFVAELVRIKEAEQVGFRVAIQNGLYGHIQEKTSAPYYSPFFIKSPDAHRSYWFIHLSKHREARNEIGMVHWTENNTSVHHGRAGLHALGFSSGTTPEQLTLEYVFDEHAKNLSRLVLKQQLPKLIYEAADADIAPSLEDLFSRRCNDTPVVRELLEEVLLDLRNESELTIIDERGKERPRTTKVAWEDRIVLPRQRSFSFRRL